MAQGASEKGANTVPFNQSKLSRSTTAYQGALNASWELDFWGKVRNQYTMLSDVLMSTVIGHEALRLSVAGQTAQGYFALLAQDMQLDTARRTLKTREDAFSIYTSRYKQGDITELDWQRARAEVETARAQVHTSTVAVDKAEAGLAVLQHLAHWGGVAAHHGTTHAHGFEQAAPQHKGVAEVNMHTRQLQ